MKKIFTLFVVAFISMASFSQEPLANLEGTYTVQGFEFKDYDMSPCTLYFTLSYDAEGETLTLRDVNNGETHVQTFNNCVLDGSKLTITQWLSEDFMVWSYYMDEDYNALNIEIEVKENGSLQFLNGMSAGYYDEENEEQYDFEITSDAIALKYTPNGIRSVQEGRHGDDNCYNLQSFKVSNPIPGNLYIINGKKVITK